VPVEAAELELLLGVTVALGRAAKIDVDSNFWQLLEAGTRAVYGIVVMIPRDSAGCL